MDLQNAYHYNFYPLKIRSFEILVLSLTKIVKLKSKWSH